MSQFRAIAKDVAAPAWDWRGPRSRPSHLDGWLGTPEFPGYRAGRCAVRLSHQPHLPRIAPNHLYSEWHLLDALGKTSDALQGACICLPLTSSVEARSRFVCVSAELLRHAAADDFQFGGVAPVISQLRELGVERAPLMAAARLLDVASSEESVIESLADMLVYSFGDDEARSTLDSIVARLVRTRHVGADLHAPASSSLREQLMLLVHGLGNHRVRHVLRMGSDFDLLPQIEMYRH